ncbi:MAG: NUDIX domain-containing protein, partial [Acidobacteria bacterium]|nr:NUDIX domain-containing protein [Acidobacteriota bacterium]
MTAQTPEKPEQRAQPATPKDAAAVILLRPGTNEQDPEVYWARRSHRLAFLGGFHAFPGGQLDESDRETPVENCDDAERAMMIACAAREVFEELGLLVARGAQALTVGQRRSLLDDLESRRMSWPELLKHYGLHLDASHWTFVGRWVTPPFSPRRFDTWFFLVNCPQKQEPHVAVDAELDAGEWTRARDAVARWKRSEVLTVPPVLHALRTLSDGLTEDLVERFLSVQHAHAVPV